MAELELILMRHAKSNWADEGVGDHERTLNDRGRRDAPRIGLWIKENDFLPDRLLCSTASRAQETAALVTEEWENDVPIYSTRNLYLATPESILAVVRADAMGASRVMIVGHNPGMEALAGHFSGACGHLPTGAVSVIALEIDEWSRLRPSTTTRILASTRPKSMD